MLIDVSTGLESVDWTKAVDALVGRGWVRLEAAVNGRTCTRLLGAAPPTWINNGETDHGTVREAGMSCGTVFAEARQEVRDFAGAIRNGVNGVGMGLPTLPIFTDVQWTRARPDGAAFITAHRDPPKVGGVIAITTLFGEATFRLWEDDADPRVTAALDAPVSWETRDGDLVLLRATGWPQPESRSLVHEVSSPQSGERITLTFRHNLSGPGADWFSD